MLHGTIRNDDFERYTALQCWNNVATIRNNVATMLRCAKHRRCESSRVTCNHTCPDIFRIWRIRVDRAMNHSVERAGIPHWFRVDGRPICVNIFAVSKIETLRFKD